MRSEFALTNRFKRIIAKKILHQMGKHLSFDQRPVGKINILLLFRLSVIRGPWVIVPALTKGIAFFYGPAHSCLRLEATFTAVI